MHYPVAIKKQRSSSLTNLYDQRKGIQGPLQLILKDSQFPEALNYVLILTLPSLSIRKTSVKMTLKPFLYLNFCINNNCTLYRVFTNSVKFNCSVTIRDQKIFRDLKVGNFGTKVLILKTKTKKVLKRCPHFIVGLIPFVEWSFLQASL